MNLGLCDSKYYGNKEEEVVNSGQVVKVFQGSKCLYWSIRSPSNKEKRWYSWWGKNHIIKGKIRCDALALIRSFHSGTSDSSRPVTLPPMLPRVGTMSLEGKSHALLLWRSSRAQHNVLKRWHSIVVWKSWVKEYAMRQKEGRGREEKYN